MVAAGFVILAVGDARRSEVVVRHAQLVTVVAIAGLGSVAVVAGNWGGLVTAGISAALITAIQLVPFGLQHGRGEWIGRADIRLGLPFGWTLGYFGLGFAFVGFGVALLSGLGMALLTRRQRIPFVPFLTVGLLFGLVWVGVSAVGG